MAEFNIGYETLVNCHEKLVSEIAQDPKQMAVTLFQHRFIPEDTKAKINELDQTKTDKGILLVDDIESKVKCYPEFYEKFLLILGENELLYCDLVKSLQEEYERIEAESKDGYKNNQLSSLQPIPWVSVTDSVVLELPSVDDGGTLPDPLEHPPDVTEVGADVRAAATSRQEAPIVDTFEGRLLQAFQSGEIDQMIELLSQAESQSIDLRGVSDADGKTLLHLACRKDRMDSYQIVCSLIEKHNCDVEAVDEDGKTPLHEAYQCGNLPIVEYLLSLPTCNPDAINKHDYTVLRMALETNDRTTARDLLATGRVDPRKGSSRGHTYPELLAMNQLQPQPQHYDGSALQMVTQFAECMEGNNHIRPPFTSYCLLKVLHKILKNRDKVSIAGIVDRIKENMLPLPEKPDEIHDLLVDILRLSNEFEVCGEPTDIQIRKKEDTSEDTSGTKLFQRDIQQESSTGNTPQNVTVPADVEDTSDVLPLLPSHTEETTRNAPQKLAADPTDNEDDETPDYYSNPSELVSILQPASSHIIKKKQTMKPKVVKAAYRTCICCCSFWFVVFFILGITGAILYDDYSLVNTTSVALIHRQSVPLIATHDLSIKFFRFSEISGTSIVPITFYELSDCSSFADIELNEIVTVSFDSPTVKTKAVTELYMLGNTTISIDITTEVLPQYSPDSCFTGFVLFDDLNNYLNFISNSESANDYYLVECIANKKSQTKSITFNKTSYYYISVFTKFPTEVATYTLRFLGTYLQYDISNRDPLCTIDSRALSCDLHSLDTNSLRQICIVGFVPPTDLLFGIRLITLGYYTADSSNVEIDTYFFIPLICMCSVLLVCAVICACVIFIRRHRGKRQTAHIT